MALACLTAPAMAAGPLTCAAVEHGLEGNLGRLPGHPQTLSWPGGLTPQMRFADRTSLFTIDAECATDGGLRSLELSWAGRGSGQGQVAEASTKIIAHDLAAVMGDEWSLVDLLDAVAKSPEAKGESAFRTLKRADGTVAGMEAEARIAELADSPTWVISLTLKAR